MSKNPKNGTPNPNPSGDETDPKDGAPEGGDQGGGGEPAPAKTYSEAEFNAMRKRAEAAEAKEREAEQKKKEDARKAAEASGEWQQVAETSRKEADDARAEVKKLKDAFIYTEKTRALKEAAIAAGIRKESVADLGLIDFPELVVETDEEGSIKVSGADKAVTRLKTIRSHWFQGGAPKVNHNTPTATRSGGGGVTIADLEAAEKEARKTGDYSDYKNKVLQFKTQKRG